ncbi:class I SAM-dependent methyltransferase [Pseudoalteromonas umbrosa]|uniref:class I SAM-dependent methyltransferase n=1 Tax=Pseudoalteromonas umbrosa TaxID=3048489 RepID=UPI0024C3750B|nr:class I SAM-dependent methyltransferase [Pseudoalteromonas sp. B95]MDK1290063.1 class I SAM-dependent methyltransferase [Pseudoalteromonas sp. B95]
MSRRQKRDFNLSSDNHLSNLQESSSSSIESIDKSTSLRKSRRTRRDFSAMPVTEEKPQSKRLSGTLSFKRQGSTTVVQAADSKLSSLESSKLHTKTRREQYELLDPRRYVTESNNIWIGKEDWALLLKKYNTSEHRSVLIRLLEKVVLDNGMSMPTREITRDAAWKSFLDLKRADFNDFMAGSRTDSRFTYQQPLGMLTILANNVGNFAGDYFFQDIRWTCRGSLADSPAESWKDPKVLRSVFHRLLDSSEALVSRDTLRKYVGIRRYIPTPDRPFVSKALFDYFQPESVLDLSVGWGSRLLGFEAAETPLVYHGIDPDKRIVEASRKLDKFCRQTRKTVSIYREAAEDFSYELIDPVDMIMFAPPPFNNERYTKDQDQAYIRYPSIDDFLDEFLKKTIVKAWDCLKIGGTLVIELGDLKAPKFDDFNARTGGRYRLVEPLMSIIKRELPDAKYMGTIGAGVASAKPSANFDATLRGDPAWIFTKQSSQKAASLLLGKSKAKEVYHELNAD